MEHTVKSFLDFATTCTTEPDALTLLTALKQSFLDSPGLAWLTISQDEFCVEDGAPAVSFELNRVISCDYVTTIRPAIRRGKMSVQVVTKHMRDGLGLKGKSWDVVEHLDYLLSLESGAASVDALAFGTAIYALAFRAEQAAISHHASLLNKLAVPYDEAESLAAKLWKMRDVERDDPAT